MSNETIPAPRVQSVGDPARLGLAGFARTTFVLSAVNVGWIPKHGDPVVLDLDFAYGAFDPREEGHCVSYDEEISQTKLHN